MADVEDGTCYSTSHCRNDELCVDGTCQPYRWYSWPAEEEDVASVVEDSGLIEDADVPVITDATTDQMAPEPDIADSSAADSATTEDVADTQKTVTAVIQEDEYEDGKGENYVSLVPGEAWAADLEVPLDGAFAGLQVVVDDLLSNTSCGRFRAMLFQEEEGVFPDKPTWTSPQTFELVGSSKPQYLFIDDPVPLSKGMHRVGLYFDSECEGGSTLPLLVTDKSGTVDSSWYWKETPGQSPWIPGGFLGLEGRWVLRLLLEVPM